MTTQQIKDYRDKIDVQLKEKVSEIESNISLIIIGSLGFFLTINEKFIGLREAKCIGWMFASIFLLLVSFALFLLNKYLTARYDKQIIDLLDAMPANDTAADGKLWTKWDRTNRTTTRIRSWVYITVLVGIICQVFFFVTNLRQPQGAKKEMVPALKIEIKTSDTTLRTTVKAIDSSTIRVETKK